MFSKSFIIFGLLALFACQGTTAAQHHEIERASLADLIKQVREIISGLNDIMNGVLGDALATLGNLVSTVGAIKEKFLDEGISVITEGVGNVLEFVANKTAQAADLGIDITKCILGTNETLATIAQSLTGKLTNCVTDMASSVLDTVNKEIKNLNDIVKTIVAAPVKLSKCLISLRPISCVTKLLGDLTTMVTTLPVHIARVVADALALVKELPTNLVVCVVDITSSVHNQTEAMIDEIGTCVDDIISQSTTTAATDATTEAATDATTEAATDATTAAATEATTEAATEATTAAALKGIYLPRASLGELVDKVKEIIASLNDLVSGVIGDALNVIGGLVSTINEIKDKYLGDGIALIKETIGSVTSFIKEKTEQAIELGVDISKCLVGREAQLEDLSLGLVANLTDCITTSVSQVLTMVTQDIQNVNKIVSQVTGAPVKLAKCLISLKPFSCVTDLVTDLSTLLTTIPAEVKEIVGHAVTLVETLPSQLGECLGKIGAEATAQTEKIIEDIGTCVDDIVAGGA